MTAPSHVLDHTLCSRAYVCVCVTPPPWFISSDSSLFRWAITVYWESALSPCTNCLHHIPTCMGIWRFLLLTQGNPIKSHHWSLVIMVMGFHCVPWIHTQRWTNYLQLRCSVMSFKSWTLCRLFEHRKPPVVCSSTPIKMKGWGVVSSAVHLRS